MCSAGEAVAGDLGIRHPVRMALGIDYLKNRAAAAEKGAFGGYVNFTVTKSLSGVGPTWTLTHVKGPGGLGSLSEVNIDKLSFAFAESATPLTAAQYAKRQQARKSGVTRSALRNGPPGNSRAEQFLQQLQLNQISNQLSIIRSFP